MATDSDTGLEQIGVTAGAIWHLLSEKGPQALTKIIKEVDAPRDVVLQAIGWLAREDKIQIEEGARSRSYALREAEE